MRGGEYTCVTGKGPEEAGRGRVPEGRLRTAVAGVPLSQCPAVSGWCLRRRLARDPGAQWPQGGRGVGVGEVAALVDLARFQQTSGWTVAPFPLRLFLQWMGAPRC